MEEIPKGIRRPITTSSFQGRTTTSTQELFAIRSKLLMNESSYEENEENNEDKEERKGNTENRKSNLVLISEERLMQALSCRRIAGCKFNEKYKIEFIRDGFEMKINQICHECKKKKKKKSYAYKNFISCKKCKGKGGPGAYYL